MKTHLRLLTPALVSAALLFAPARARAGTVNVTKADDGTNQITQDLNFPDARTLSVGTTTPGLITGSNGTINFAAQGINQNANIIAPLSGKTQLQIANTNRLYVDVFGVTIPDFGNNNFTPGTTAAFKSSAQSGMIDNVTPGGGTTAEAWANYFGNPTLKAANAGVTTTDAATIKIAGGPLAGANETLTNSWGLWNAGNTRLDGPTTLTDIRSPAAGATWGADTGATGFQIWGTGGGGNANKIKIRVASVDYLVANASAISIPLTADATVGGAGALTTAGGIYTAKKFYAAGGILGTPTNDSAATGIVGEYVSSTVASGAAVALTTGVTANVTSISLTAGDWDVTGVIDFANNATTVMADAAMGVSTTSATLGAQDTFERNAVGVSSTRDLSYSIPLVRVSLAATTPVYLVTNVNFSVSTASAYGTIRARRVR